jgi:hypothetical protein
LSGVIRNRHDRKPGRPRYRTPAYFTLMVTWQPGLNCSRWRAACGNGSGSLGSGRCTSTSCRAGCSRARIHPVAGRAAIIRWLSSHQLRYRNRPDGQGLALVQVMHNKKPAHGGLSGGDLATSSRARFGHFEAVVVGGLLHAADCTGRRRAGHWAKRRDTSVVRCHGSCLVGGESTALRAELLA